MSSNEFYRPPEAKVEEKLDEPKARKLAIAGLGFLSSYLGIMLFFVSAEIALKSEPVDFIFETGFQIAIGVCSGLAAIALFPMRKMPWYFHVLIAPAAGLAILIGTLFSISAIMN